MVNISFVGDIMPGGMFCYGGGIGDEVLQILHQGDLCIGTLETAIGDGHKLCHLKNTPELGTIIYSPDETVQMLSDMHVNAVSLANNHSCDCDLEGLYHTMDLLDRYGIVHFGAGHNSEEASRPGILHSNGKSICLLGYLKEYKYFYRGEGYVPSDNEGGLNIYNFKKAQSDIKKYKKQYDYVFVMPHWGTEGSAFPKFNEADEAKKLIGAGADGVISSHAHIVQPIFQYKGKILAMNLGNFAFPDRYVRKPRITCYPSVNEIQNTEIPIVESFKLVDRLTLKKVALPERRGCILRVAIDEHGLRHDVKYTLLNPTNIVECRKKRSLDEIICSGYAGLLVKGKFGILYRVHSRIRSIFK